MQDISKEIMNEIEQEKILAFTEDKIMFEAVKKYVLFYLYQGIAAPGKPFEGGKNYALQLAWDRQGGAMDTQGRVVAFAPKSDADLGADLRALARGINIVESGFKELADIKRPVVSEPEKDNPAL